ncbi:MAG TPA: DnaB-like helicase C-terminal domain-containing protein, partial [Adhaeribacter sp.]|nr:DnaB-like helicase C-terminal domain-containing protein [Adhaeribacter sp.]
ADMVIFLYRPEYYGITEDEMGNPTQGTGEVIIAKHRNGSLASVNLKFIGKFTKFGDLEGEFAGDGFGGNNFPTSDFDSPAPNTIRLGSKMNGDDFGGGGGLGGFPKSGFDEEAPF